MARQVGCAASHPFDEIAEGRYVGGNHLSYPDPDLIDDRVRLRRWRYSDLACVEAAASDPQIPTGTTVPSPYTEDEGRAFIERQWSRNDDGGALALAVAVRDTDEAIGQVYLGLSGIRGECRLGYWLVPEMRRRGFGSHAIALAADWLLHSSEVYRLVAEVHPENTASRRLLEKCGFTEEGTLRSWLWIGDEPHDAVQYSLIRPDLEVAAD